MIKNPPVIKKIVLEMGGKIEKVIPERGYFFIKIRGEKIFVSRKFKISSNLISGGEITKFKDLTYFLLKQNDLPTPKSICFYKKSFNDTLEKLGCLKLPIIIKDTKGSNSKGIFANIKNRTEAEKIIKTEIKNYHSLIAQEMVFGKEYRVLILKDRVIGALKLIPPRVFGDGKKTIKQLITKKQEKTEAKTAFDDFLKATLKDQGYALNSIPEKDKEIYIKRNSCLAEGGETQDVTDIVHKNIKEVCIKATEVTQKYLAGLDIMCDDISKSIESQNFNILEINGKPDLYIHYNPTYGKTRNVVKEIITFIINLRKSTTD